KPFIFFMLFMVQRLRGLARDKITDMRWAAMTAGFLLVAAVAHAQTPVATAPAPKHGKRLFLATLAGVASGVAIGDRISFGPGSHASKMWHMRTGMSYGAMGGGIAAAVTEAFIS